MRHRPLDPSNNLLRVYFQNSASRSRPSTLGSLITVLCLYQLRKLQGQWSRSWPLRLGAICLRSVHPRRDRGLTGVSDERMSTSRNSLVHG